MRLLVASDSHRAAGNLLDIVELHLEDSDVLLFLGDGENDLENCLLYTSPSPRDTERYRMPSSA